MLLIALVFLFSQDVLQYYPPVGSPAPPYQVGASAGTIYFQPTTSAGGGCGICDTALAWWKADTIAQADNTAVSSWADSSGNGYTATQATGSAQPTLQTGEVNALPVVRFDATDFMSFTSITTMRTVVAVMKHSTGSNATSDSPFIFGDGTTYDWLGSTNRLIVNPADGATLPIRNGSTYVNGQLDIATNLIKDTAYRIYSVVTTGNIGGSRLSNDRSAFFWAGDYVEIIVFDTALSAGDRGTVQSYLATKYGLSATSVLRPQLIIVGDSLTSNASYGSKIISCINGTCGVVATDGTYFLTTYATSGYTLVDMGTAYDATIAAAYNASRITQTIVLWGGTNDLFFGATAATTYTRLQARVTAYRAAGYTRIVIPTILPRSEVGTPVDFETSRQTVNASILSGASESTWAVADIAGNATIGEAGDQLNTTYYSDLVHLTIAGYDIVAPIVEAAIEALP